ncbi:unnamed protein product [Brachionus calyciflorus]|uniref:Purine nucleoside phosphorylase n=1 Tax=Brachionus calyciflorus TaxID=104777 RepID=A0A814A7J8_9BILA|nr:unnamed protein product [Brachionus calyciflorus]
MENSEILNQIVKKEFNLPAQLISQDAITNAYYNYEKIEEITKWISERVTIRPKIGIICGSGLGEIANLVQNKEEIQYADIPEFPRSTVHGHKGVFVFGHLSNEPVVCMQGRFHPYEGYSTALCTLPVKVFKLLGVKLAIITNAAGGLNPNFSIGDLMVIKDHFSLPILSLQHPLVGHNDERFGPRFVPITNIYDKKLRQILHDCGKELNLDLREGVYGTISGPSYETVTDSLFYLRNGADCVGMSTSHEATVACYCGIKVVAFSIITDKVAIEYDAEDGSDHNEIVKIAKLKAKDAEKLVSNFIQKLNQNLLE